MCDWYQGKQSYARSDTRSPGMFHDGDSKLGRLEHSHQVRVE